MEDKAQSEAKKHVDTGPPETANDAPGNGQQTPADADAGSPKPVEIGGPSGLEPTRYGDWERKGRCVDF